MRLRRLSTPLLLACSLSALLFAPRAAQAQRGIDAQTFRPSLDSYGIFTVERADVSHQWDFGFKLYTSYAGTSLRLTLQDPSMPTMNKSQAILDHMAAINLQFHLGLTNWLELAFDFPVAATGYTSAYGSPPDASQMPVGGIVGRSGFYEGRGITTIPPPDAAPLDARLALKAKLFRRGMFGMALAAVVTVPFGDDAAFLGDSNFTFRPNIIADFTRGPVTVAANVGAIIREMTSVYDPHEVALQLPSPRLLLEVGHELTYGVGIAYRFVHWVGLGAEVYGLVPLVGRTKDYTADVIGGLQFFPIRDLVVGVGAGAGIISSAARRDDYRAFLGISWAPAADGRGSATGGVDSDSDGVPDSQDLCPNEPEDKDGFDDEDGCPDLDNDQDGIPDRLDKCPNEPEDKDGFQDHDGCPETDNDGDGIPDAQDKCPNDPEDRDGFQDDDGCPDADNDGDGIPDVADRCPNEPETRNGVDDDDGCPDSGGQATVVAGGRIELPEQLQFELDKSTLSKKTEEALVLVAEKLKSNPGVKRVRIEGHADKAEPSKKAQALSQSRADAVREFLMRRGVDGERLQAVGYGAARPIDKRTTADARAKNRRVEFIIVEQ